MLFWSRKLCDPEFRGNAARGRFFDAGGSVCVCMCVYAHIHTHCTWGTRCEPKGRDEAPGGHEESRWTKSRHTCIHMCVQSTHVYVYICWEAGWDLGLTAFYLSTYLIFRKSKAKDVNVNPRTGATYTLNRVLNYLFSRNKSNHHMNTCIYIYINTMYVYVYVYMYIHIYKYYVCICICVYTHVYVYIYMYMYTCIYVNTYICKYIYVYRRARAWGRVAKKRWMSDLDSGSIWPCWSVSLVGLVVLELIVYYNDNNLGMNKDCYCSPLQCDMSSTNEAYNLYIYINGRIASHLLTSTSSNLLSRIFQKTTDSLSTMCHLTLLVGRLAVVGGVEVPVAANSSHVDGTLWKCVGERAHVRRMREPRLVAKMWEIKGEFSVCKCISTAQFTRKYAMNQQ